MAIFETPGGADRDVITWPYPDDDDGFVFVWFRGTPTAFEASTEADLVAVESAAGYDPGYAYSHLNDDEEDQASATDQAADKPWVRSGYMRRKRVEEITSDYFLITCAGNSRQRHKEKVIAAFLPDGRGEHPEFGGFLTDAELGQPGAAVREARPAAGRHGRALKFRFRCSRCPRDEQVIPETLQMLYEQLREARDRGDEGTLGPNGCVRLALNALPPRR